MNLLLQKVYDSSPIPLQNAMVSIYGAYLRYQRYGEIWERTLNQLRKSQYFSKTQIEELQFRNLSTLLSHAYENVDFYKRLFNERGLRPVDIKDPNDLSKLPIITKEDIRNNSQAFVSRSFRRQSLVPLHTSGTTGTPLTLWFTREAIQNNYAFYARALEWAGVKVGDKSATFGGRVFVPKRQIGPPFWRLNAFNNNVLCSSYHISEKNLPSYIRELEEINPVFIDSYPSAIYSIAQFILDKSFPFNTRPSTIITSSETLLDHQRDAISRAFQCKIYDQYGSAEMVAFICQCEHGSYHINPEYGIVELIQDGQPVPPGVPGELVCTGLLNSGMPLIRYKIGDSAVLSRDSCTCGRYFPCIQSILGRVDDIIITKDGRKIGRLDPVFKGTTGIKEAQIVQTSVDTLVVKIVKSEDYQPAGADALLIELKKRVGYDMTVTLEFVDRIEKTSSGKFRSVISLRAVKRETELQLSRA